MRCVGVEGAWVDAAVAVEFVYVDANLKALTPGVSSKVGGATPIGAFFIFQIVWGTALSRHNFESRAACHNLELCAALDTRDGCMSDPTVLG